MASLVGNPQAKTKSCIFHRKATTYDDCRNVYVQFLVSSSCFQVVSRSQTRPRLLPVGGRGSGKVPLISRFFRPLHSMGHKDIKISA